MIEFYGEVSDYTKRRADKLKKRHFALWLGALALLSCAVTAVSAATSGRFVVFLICTLVLAALAACLYFLPMSKKPFKDVWKFRVVVENGVLTFTQYLPGKTVEKVKKLDRVKRVIKTDYCYYVVFNDISNAVVCERCLLKKGTFAAFESLFPPEKMREKNIP